MEEKEIRFLNENRELVLQEIAMYEYHVKSETKGRLASRIVVAREEKGYNKEIDEIEKGYKKHRYLAWFYPLGAAALAFVLVNILFAFFFANKSLAGDIWWAFIVPAALLLGGSVFLLFYRLRQVENFQIDLSKQNKEVRAKVKELKQKYQ